MINRFLVLMVFTYFLVIPSVQSQCSVPIIVTPNGGEELLAGEEYTINYYYNYNPEILGLGDKVDFYYSLDNGLEWIFVDSIPVDSSLAVSGELLSFNWVIPNTISDSCLIKIIKYTTWCWDESEAVFNIVSSLSSNNRIENQNQINIYPNPSNVGQQISVELFDNQFETAILYDTNGKVVQRIEDLSDSIFRINTSSLSKGLYIFFLIKDGKTLVNKVLIN